MPADRGRPSTQTGASGRDECWVLATAWSSAASNNNHNSHAPNDSSYEPALFEQEMHPLQRAPQRRKKAPNHIPRPPNAFILFRSSFIKNRHVSTEVETSHSTLSKIIGLTWKNLPEDERQKWHAQAKVVLDDHRRQFPQYAFRPVHTKSKGTAGERRKPREVGQKDQKRCAKIAELLVCGKKGQELEEAIQEFDKHHVPEIITRFDTPITANTYVSATKERMSTSPVVSKPAPTTRQKGRTPPILNATTQSHPEDSASREAPNHSLETRSFDTFIESPSFDYDPFSFSVDTSHSFPMNLPDVNYSMAHAYDTQLHSQAHLSPDAHYPDDWPGRNSPLSTSTSSSMPATPLQLCMPFEPFGESYNPGAYPINDTGTDYTSTGDTAAYCDFTQYPPFSSVPESGYGVSCTGTNYEQQPAHVSPPASGLALGDGRFHLLPINNSTHLEQQLDFSSLMHSLSSSATSYL